MIKRFYSSQLRAGDTLFNYSVVKSSCFPEFDIKGFVLKHKTGAEHLHLQSSEMNNVFGCTFQTPPSDSTGVAHILEHTVLCGSRKYPVRDPFFKMLNRSMSTFMNAMTGNDFTMYPFSTQNETDYYNLMSVYMDAMFFPNLLESDYRQEGWRLENADPTSEKSPIIFKGVVFNEMKGALSDQTNLFCTRLQQKMFPATTYSHVSGGDPLIITDLTHEQLVEFHRENYHPSNAKFVTFGSFSLEKQLEFIDSVISKFSKKPIKSLDKIQKFNVPVEILEKCPPDPVGDPSKQTKISVTFLGCDNSNVLESMCLKLITMLLMNGASSPMYKALIASNIASDYVASAGFDQSTLKSSISFGVNGISLDQIPLVKKVISDTLQRSFQDLIGFEKERIKEILHQMELSLKHKSPSFGMGLAQSVSRSWIHGADPLESLAFSTLIDKISALFLNPVTSEKFIKEKLGYYFIKNPHKLTFVMEPSKDFNSELKVSESLKLAKMTSGLTESDRKSIFEQGIQLLKLQDEKPNLECLPTLQVRDIKKETEIFPVDFIQESTSIQKRIAPTNGLAYFRIRKSLGHVPADLLRYLNIFCTALTSLGTELSDLEKLDHDIRMNSGGINFSVDCYTSVTTGNPQVWLEISSHYLENHSDSKLQSILRIVSEVLSHCKWTDKERLFTVLAGIQADYSNSMASSGHRLALSTASKNLSAALQMQDQLGGLGQLNLLTLLVPDKPSETSNDLIQKLQSIAQLVTRNSEIKASINCSTEKGISEFTTEYNSFIQKLEWRSEDLLGSTIEFSKNYLNEYIVTPFAVNYCARSFPTVGYTEKENAYFQLFAPLLTSNFLHREIREKGGAYGGGCRFNAMEGVFSMFSYRDPNPENTLECFKRALDFSENLLCNVGQRELDEAKLSVFSSVDAPIGPALQGMSRFRYNVSDELKQQRREWMLNATLSDLHKAAQTLQNSSTAIIGTKEKLVKFPDFLKVE